MARVISAVVLAAGSSTRMGRHKLLLPLGGEPMVRRTVREIAQAGFDEVLVVTGFERARVADALDGLAVRIIINEEFARGMGSSFRTAVAALGASDAAVFALADQPFVTAVEYRRVLDAWLAHAPGIVCVTYGDVIAPPHLFSREFFPELTALEHGARPVLQRHKDRTFMLRLPPELLLDVDTPEDYERATRRLSPET